MSQRLSASLKNAVNINTLNNCGSLPGRSKGSMDNSVYTLECRTECFPVSNVPANILDALPLSPVRALRKVKNAYRNTLIAEALGKVGAKKPSPPVTKTRCNGIGLLACTISESGARTEIFISQQTVVNSPSIEESFLSRTGIPG